MKSCYKHLDAYFGGGKVTKPAEDKHFLVNPSGSDRGLFSEAEEKAIQEKQDRDNLPKDRDPASKSNRVNIDGGYIEYAGGGVIPGTPKVPGDSPKNDTIFIKASPGEVVLPRSITQRPDAAERAKRYMKIHQYLQGATK